MTQTNPLAKHFRQPSTYIKLTSKGQFWKEGSLELTTTGEIPVYPMTARDEITLRTPDALLSGLSVVNVIQSCCPNIKDAWEMPSIDVDTTLISIRIASYGDTMPVTAKCPNCKEEHDYDINLHEVLNTVTSPDYANTVLELDGLSFKFRPLTYRQVSKVSTLAFEEEKLIKTLTDETKDTAARSIEFEKRVNSMIEMNNANLTDATLCITADGVDITDQQFISEYYANAKSTVIRAVKKQIKQFSEVVSLKPVDTHCTDCNTSFKINIDFDYSRFFGTGF